MKKSEQKCLICGKIKEVSLGGNGIQYPIYSCPEHGPDKENLWEEWWTEYHDIYKDQDAWKDKKNLPSCIIGYFCDQFFKFYGFYYTLDYSTPVPYKNKDFTMARRIVSMFGDDYSLIPEYIRWVFSKRVKTKKRTVNSLGFFAVSNFINEYKTARERSKIVKRSTKLPNNFLNWCNENYPEVFENQELRTWNDLNGLISHVKCYGKDNVEWNILLEAVNRNMLSSGPDGPNYKKLED